jgi:hypothetical protein
MAGGVAARLRSPFSAIKQEETIKDATSASPLVAALNDPSRTLIGNPWRGTYYVSIEANDWEAMSLLSLFRELGIRVQVNVARWNPAQSIRYVTVYDHDGLRSLLSALGDELKEPVRTALDILVRARGPIPEPLVQVIRRKHDVYGLSFHEIAHLMNDKRIVDGMGGRGWSGRKVSAAYKGVAPKRSTVSVPSIEVVSVAEGVDV